MVTGKSQPATEPIPPLPTSPDPVDSNSPPSKRDLASWWRQFKRNTRKDELKGTVPTIRFPYATAMLPLRREFRRSDQLARPFGVRQPPRGIFGVPLNVSIKYANVAISLTNDHGESFIYGYVPIVVAKCGVFLKEKATDVEGIFRLNGSAKRIKDLQEIFDSPERYGKGLDWTGYTVHDAANVLRRYLNQLPEPIVPLEFYERFREPLRTYQKQAQSEDQAADADKFDHAKAVETYQRLIIELPPLNKQLLLYILDLLAVFASKSDQNRMPSGNLSAIFQPGMLSHPQHDMSPEEYKLSQDVLIFLIENQDHFLFGMSGTAADEQTMKEVEAGMPPKTSHSNIRRSVSSASGSTEGHRKLDTLRRNVSVSSKNSRNSNNAPSPGTPTSASGGGVHRSNTLPSKMTPVVASARYSRPNEASATNQTGLSASHQSSRSTSRTPSVLEESEEQDHSQATVGPSTLAASYKHTSTHGPVPVAASERLSTSDTPRPQEILQTPTSPPPQALTPTRERKLSSLFSKSPPADGEQKETRQPNRLKKRRIPGSASASAQSSSNSLQGVNSESVDTVLESSRGRQSADISMGDTTPRPAQSATLGSQAESNANPGENTPQPATDSSLRPHKSRTPSMNSRSSFTDHSDLDQTDEASRSERRDHRRSWRFPRSSKRSSEQLGLGLSSPPLAANNPGAEQSSSSVGNDVQNASSDLSGQPLSLDAEVQGNGASSSEPEKKSLFGKFKAKVAQVRDGVKDDRDRNKSPGLSDTDPSLTSQPLSPTSPDQANGTPPSTEAPREQSKEEPLRSPVSPMPGGLPPSIPEEPHSPVVPSAAPAPDPAKDVSQAASTETAEAPTSAPVSSSDASKEASKEAAEPTT
ncbi:hypothetical protein N7474_009191 [Penicillium riverlandense]|uniref:uncharacterized protein n=1 Tax=Penicillium riverlandense TaxID=1903569 RepID=UPI002549AF00|nr:uncharacterized protein N7474_009191 [Penicillium riverlandense]KAJ5807922.1 hypothetical protein N7474_009191 [Penicillium riverlandense]